MKSPINSSWKTELVPVFFIIISFVLSFYFYRNFPDQVATHWNLAGEPDSYSNKAFGAFFFPVFSLITYLILLFIPYIDPRKNNYQQFSKVYHIFKAAMVGFLVFIYIYTGLSTLGLPIAVNKAMPLAIGLLFMLFGYYLPKVKPNWFLGIRTPWTLSNETVWQKTHQLGGKIFIIAGLIIFIVSLVQPKNELMTGLIFPGIVLMAITPVIYSYLVYRQEEKK